MTSLPDAWSTVEGKHDIYLMYLNEEEITANEKWIKELQEEYNEASAVYILSMTMKEKLLNWRNKQNWTANYIKSRRISKDCSTDNYEEKIHGSNLWIFNWTC